MASVAHTQLCCCQVRAAAGGSVGMSECSCVPIKYYLRVLLFGLHKIFMCHEILLF